MDNTPDYLKYLDTVAKTHGETSSLASLGMRLGEQWMKFETLVKSESYDVLLNSLHDWSGVIRSMQELCELLYHIPGANWEADTATLRAKDKEYGGSWHRRGGQGAFFMLARKWDRIAKQLDTFGNLEKALEVDRRQEGILDDFTDLRCYLLLVLSWHEARKNPIPVAMPIEEEHPF